MADNTTVKYTTTPRSIVFITKGRKDIVTGTGEMTPLPVIEYSLIKNNNDTPDQVNLKCDLTMFPLENFKQLFMADGRSGLFVIEVYTNYVDDVKTFVKNTNGNNEYNPELISKIKTDDCLRFYGLSNSPEYRESLEGRFLNLTAYDISYVLRENRIVKYWKETTCVDIIKDVVEATNLTNYFDIAPRVNTTTKMGQKGIKDGFIYIARNISRWQVIQDAAKRLGEDVRVKKRKIQIGRFTPFVNKFNYWYGYKSPSSTSNINLTSSNNKKLASINDIVLKKQPRLDEEDIIVNVVVYNQETKEYRVGQAAQYQKEMFDQMVKEAKDNTDTSNEDSMKTINTKRFTFYYSSYEGDLNDLAEKLLSNIIYKRWLFSFRTVGNPLIEIDDIVAINNYWEGTDFNKIKWRVSKIEEKYSCDRGYEMFLDLEGVLLEDVDGLEAERQYTPPSSTNQYSTTIGSSNGDSSGGGGLGNIKGTVNSQINDKDIYNPPQDSTYDGSTTYDVSKFQGYNRTSDYGMRWGKPHTGIDYGIPTGTSLKTKWEGTIVYTGWCGGYGKRIVIKHPDGYYTTYNHLSSISVKAGNVVKKGDVIGKTGSTGHSTGPHLHYEVMNRNSNYIDPEYYNGPL